MTSGTRKLLTIITEAAIEHLLEEDLEQLGAHGYTVTDVRGKGHRGLRKSDWETAGNIRIEVVVAADLAGKITEHLRSRYFDHYAMILYMTDVDVLRPEKF